MPVVSEPHPAIDVVGAARNLAPLILAAREEGERIRHVPRKVANALAEAGLLQMFLPRSMGGPELDPLAVFHAIEALSRADGSIGWCAISPLIYRSSGAGSVRMSGASSAVTPPISAPLVRCGH